MAKLESHCKPEPSCYHPTGLRDQRSNIVVGCCGFPVAQKKYFQAFRFVEINSSFYQLPKLDTVARWRAAAAPDFQFSMKAWQAITHRATSPTYKRTHIDNRDREYCGHFGFNPTIRWAWDETFAVAKALRVFLVLFQCPPNFRQNSENIARLKQFFERAKRGRFHMGLEPRGEWDEEVIAKLCRELDLIHVVDPFQSLPGHRAKVQYFRLHGSGPARNRYTDQELDRLKGLCAGRTPTYCAFNNRAMASDSQRFAALVRPG